MKLSTSVLLTAKERLREIELDTKLSFLNFWRGMFEKQLDVASEISKSCLYEVGTWKLEEEKRLSAIIYGP